MGIYSTVETAFVDMVKDIITSPQICKLLYYDDYDPLNKPDVSNPANMIYKGGDIKEQPQHRIILIPKLNTVSEYKKTMILPRIINIEPTGDGRDKNIFFRDFSVAFDIVTHVSLWTIQNNGIRVLQIADLLNDLYDKQRKKYGIGKGIPHPTPYIQPSDDWCGYRLIYRFTNISRD